MAVGERRFSTKDMEVKKFQRRVVANGDYDATLLSQKAEVRKSKQNVNGLPYLSVPFEILGTEGDSGKNVHIYHNLFLTLKPGKDGVANVERENGLLALIKGFGEQVDWGSDYFLDMHGEAILNPKRVLQWLQNHHGDVVRVRVASETNREYGTQNRIRTFIEQVVDEDSGDTSEEESGEIESSNDMPEEMESFASPEIETASDENELSEEEQSAEIEEEPQEEELPMAVGAKKNVVTMTKATPPKGAKPMALRSVAKPAMKTAMKPAKKK